MSDEEEYLSEESYEFEFEDDDEADISNSILHSHDNPVCPDIYNLISSHSLTNRRISTIAPRD